MKRDMELVRKILFYLEEKDDCSTLNRPLLPGYSGEQIAYHCKLLYEAGLIDEYNEQWADNRPYFYTVGNLTWDGHDFLDKIREDTVWNKTKDVIKNKGLPMVLDVIKDVASGIIQGMVQAALNGISG